MDGFLVDAPPLRQPAWVEQFWGDLTFLHWPVDPASVAPLFPPDTAPDVFTDGLTYVGLVPFVMHRSAVAGRVPLPYFGAFAETNVRLYSVDGAGRHGVLFRSLETTRLAVVGLTRLGMGVPYTWAKLRVARSGDRITYAGTRRWPERGLRTLAEVAIGEPVDPTPLEVWLTARWGAHTRKAGRTWWVPNEHPAWPLRQAELVELTDDLVPASGVVPVGPPLRALFSPGVRARFGRPTALRS
ncbi:YqjF family protein [Mycobacterium sp. HM-7]